MTAFVQTQVVELLIQGIFEVNSDLTLLYKNKL